MIDIKMKYQGSIFVNARDLSPSPDKITMLVDAFRDKEFIPNTFHEMSRSSPQPRVCLRLSSTTKEWDIQFGMQRIDILKNPIDPKGNNLGTLDDFSASTTDFFKRINDKFKKKANRISLVANYLLGEMTDAELSRTYSKLFKPVPFYDKSEPFEWSWRLASRISHDFNEFKEDLNIVTSINRASGELTIKEEIKPFDRIQISVDINTPPVNPEYRFEFTHVEDFFENVTKLHNNILNEIEEYLYE